MRLPISVRSPGSGHLYSATARTSCHRQPCRPLLPPAADFADRLANAFVGPAAAEVPAQSAADVFVAGMGVLIEKRLARHHEARRAESALLRVVVDEGLLHRVEARVAAQRLHRCDLAPLHI